MSTEGSDEEEDAEVVINEAIRLMEDITECNKEGGRDQRGD